MRCRSPVEDSNASLPSGNRDRSGEQAADRRVPGRAEALAPLLRRAGRPPAVPVGPQGVRRRVGPQGRHEGARRQGVIAPRALSLPLHRTVFDLLITKVAIL